MQEINNVCTRSLSIVGQSNILSSSLGGLAEIGTNLAAVVFPLIAADVVSRRIADPQVAAEALGGKVSQRTM